MLSPAIFYQSLQEAGISLFAGVPDSLLKDFCAYVTDHTPKQRHVITSNEGSAIALAMGHHLATGGVGLIYMQNSGLGNATNPLTSLADPAIYGIPMLLVIGWRGEPGHKDEPQHVHMGKVTRTVLDALEVPHRLLPADEQEARAAVAQVMTEIKQRSAPQAFVVRKGTFEKYQLRSERAEPYPLTREEVIARFVAHLLPGAVIVSTTGKPSRELFEVREARGEPHETDLLIVGGMGHASQIALGVALEQPDRPVYCLDGDGAVLMHTGGLASIGTLAPPNYRHVVLNNGAHDSVGGQPTVGFEVDICAIARASGYRSATLVTEAAGLDDGLRALSRDRGPALLEVRVKKGSRSDLGRPTMTPADLKRALMAFMRRQ